MPKNKTVAVIGGGLAGLAAARLLCLRGMTVKLYETNGKLGGLPPKLNVGLRFGCRTHAKCHRRKAMALIKRACRYIPLKRVQP